MNNINLKKNFILLLVLSLAAGGIRYAAPAGETFAADSETIEAASLDPAVPENLSETIAAECTTAEECSTESPESAETAGSTCEPAEVSVLQQAEEKTESAEQSCTEASSGTAGETDSLEILQDREVEISEGSESGVTEEPEAADDSSASMESSEEGLSDQTGQAAEESSTESVEEPADQAAGDGITDMPEEHLTEETEEGLTGEGLTEEAEEGITENAEKCLTEEAEEGLTEETEEITLARVRRASSPLRAAQNVQPTKSEWEDSTEDPLKLASEYPDYFDFIDTSSASTAYADSKYCFTITPNEQSQIQYFVDNGYESLACIHTELTSLCHESTDPIPIYGGYGIVPQDDALSGHLGVWIYNAGNYFGKNIDVKITILFHSITAPLSADANETETGTIFPIIMFSLRHDGLLGVDTEDLGVELKYELFSRDESGEEVPVYPDMCLNFGDIDGNQTYGFKVEDGDPCNKPQIISSGCEVRARPHVDGYDGYFWMISSFGADYSSEPYAPGEVRFELNQTHSFRIVYGSWMEYFDTGLHDNRYHVNQYENLTQNFGWSVQRYEECCDMVQEGEFSVNSLNHYDTEGGKNLRRLNISYFTSYSFLPYDLPAPVKKAVYQTDEEEETSTLAEPSETFTYEISQFVPLQRPDYYYTSFTMEDVLPSGLEPVQGTYRVRNFAGTDKTSLFDCSFSDGTVTFSAADSAVSSKDFYNTEYIFSFDVKLTEDMQEKRGSFSFINSAKACAVGYQGTVFTENSNEVETKASIQFQKPKITITKVIDRQVEAFGTPSFLFRIREVSQGREYYVCIPMTDGALSGQKTIEVEGGKAGADAAYTIEEIGIARYQTASVEGDATGAVTVSGSTASAVLHKNYGSNAESQQVSVTFKDVLANDSECSHTDTVINIVSAETSSTSQ